MERENIEERIKVERRILEYVLQGEVAGWLHCPQFLFTSE